MGDIISGYDVFEEFKKKTFTRDYEPIKTGLEEIDKALGGGLMRGTFVTLGAAPGAGKTALCQWLFENIAEAGREVIYINLEMSTEQLIARSISRRIWKKHNKTMNALEVLRGYSWKESDRAAINDTLEEYRAKVAPKMFYAPVGADQIIKSNTIDDIEAGLRQLCENRISKGEEAPLICIDYLHLIDGQQRELSEALKGSMLRLKKEIALKYNTVVLCVIANNREANKQGITETESGRDTSAIEYSADIMLGLSYTAIKEGQTYNYKGNDQTIKAKDGKAVFDLKAIRIFRKAANNPNYAESIKSSYPDAGTTTNGKPYKPHEQITLQVNKNRFGSIADVNLIFDERHLNFEQVVTDSFLKSIKDNLPFKA